MKEEESAPSAKILLKKKGNSMAIKYASYSELLPK
jgi:hypothetical protein